MTAFEKYQSIENQKAKDNFYEACSVLMDVERRKTLKAEMKPTTDSLFLEAYCQRHQLETGEVFAGADI